jgi:hypothetical protein
MFEHSFPNLCLKQLMVNQSKIGFYNSGFLKVILTKTRLPFFPIWKFQSSLNLQDLTLQGVQKKKKKCMNHKEHKNDDATKNIRSVKFFDMPDQHAQPPLGSVSETASGMPWKYLQFKIGVSKKVINASHRLLQNQNEIRIQNQLQREVHDSSNICGGGFTFNRNDKMKNKSPAFCCILIHNINWYNTTEKRRWITNLFRL